MNTGKYPCPANCQHTTDHTHYANGSLASVMGPPVLPTKK